MHVPVKGYQLRLGLFAAVLLLLVVNALAPWGDIAAHQVYVVLQAATGVGAMLCALVVVRRVSGTARTWRLFVIASFGDAVSLGHPTV